MKKRTPSFGKTIPAQRPEKVLHVADLPAYCESWVRDGDFSNRSSTTLDARRRIVGKLIWFLTERKRSTVGPDEVRAFLGYVKHGHEEDGGRWDVGGTRPACLAAPRPSTVKTYFAYLRAFFAWCVKQGYAGASPITPIPTSEVPQDDITPFTLEQKQRLVTAAEHSRHTARDVAVIKLMLGTGLRVSEVCGIRLEHIDLDERLITVMGKGRKKRSVPFGRKVGQALWTYMRDEARHIEAKEKKDLTVPLFLADRGRNTGDVMTRWGIAQIVERLNKEAEIDTARCSPHTFRHTFAIDYLRKGGNVFALKRILGHKNLDMTNKYVAYADNDLAKMHRQCCPVDDL